MSSIYVLDARTATGHFPGIGYYAVNLARAMASQLGPGERLILQRDPAQLYPGTCRPDRRAGSHHRPA